MEHGRQCIDAAAQCMAGARMSAVRVLVCVCMCVCACVCVRACGATGARMVCDALWLDHAASAGSVFRGRCVRVCGGRVRPPHDVSAGLRVSCCTRACYPRVLDAWYWGDGP
jgi:hypothetical protein